MNKFKLSLLFVFFLFPIFLCAQNGLLDPAKADSYYKEGRVIEALYIYKNIKLNDNTNKYDSKISEIESLLADEDKANELFQQCIINGNSSYKINDYENAYICFKAALIIKPESNFPKSKLRDLSKHIQDPMIEKEFELKKEKADLLFAEGKYSKADIAYDEALVIKPNDKYILEQKLKIEEINIQMAEFKKQYDSKISKADKLFKQKEYDAALIVYQEASELIPAEDYPNEKIAEINAIYEELANMEERYANLISQADAAFLNEDYVQSQELFTQALELKPNAEYPAGRINSINEILAKINAKDNEIKAIRENISIAIEAEQFNVALSHIQTGLRLLPNDPEFINRKNYVDSIMNEKKLSEMNYSNFVSRADEFYNMEDYEQALRYYNRAKDLKATSDIESKIIKTEGMIAKVKAKNEAASESIKTETTTTNVEQTDEVASNQPSDDSDKKVTAEDKIQYEAAIKRGDLKFGRQDYDAAKKEYQDALRFNPKKSYPQKMITQIDTIIAQYNRAKLAQQEAEQKAYQERMDQIRAMNEKPADVGKMLAEGISFYDSKVYDKAIERLETALKADPGNKEAAQYRDDILILFNKNISRVIVSHPTMLTSAKQSFKFDQLTIPERNNTYLAITLSTTATSTPKVFLNFYANNARKGGMVFKELTENLSHKPIYVKISDIMAWKRDDINKIEVFSENGESNLIKLEIISIK